MLVGTYTTIRKHIFQNISFLYKTKEKLFDLSITHLLRLQLIAKMETQKQPFHLYDMVQNIYFSFSKID